MAPQFDMGKEVFEEQLSTLRNSSVHSATARHTAEQRSYTQQQRSALQSSVATEGHRQPRQHRQGTCRPQEGQPRGMGKPHSTGGCRG